MRNLKFLSLIGLAAIMALSSCRPEELPATGELVLNLTGLEDLGSDFAYEGWLILNGNPVSTGLFTVDGNGNLSQSTFDLNLDTLDNASTFVLTIEPSPDPDPAPSDVHILAGDFSGADANLSVDHSAALGTDFTTASGGYILATPTDGADNNELSGVWFLDPGAGPGPALDLPVLPAGWAYEGWAVIDGVPVTTGTFTAVAEADAAAPFSGNQAGPPFPGEDFLNNAPSGLSFPTDLSGRTIVVSVEPVPDNSSAPFLLKPLVGEVPATAADHTLYGMNNNAANTNPGGSVRR